MDLIRFFPYFKGGIVTIEVCRSREQDFKQANTEPLAPTKACTCTEMSTFKVKASKILLDD